MTPTEEKIAKLPRWAQDHIKSLTHERDVSVRALSNFCDESTPSPFEVEEYVCTGERQGPSLKRHFIQAHSIKVRWRGVELRVDANEYGQSGQGIRLSWNSTSQQQDCAMIPLSYNAVKLTCKEDMR